MKARSTRFVWLVVLPCSACTTILGVTDVPPLASVSGVDAGDAGDADASDAQTSHADGDAADAGDAEPREVANTVPAPPSAVVADAVPVVAAVTTHAGAAVPNNVFNTERGLVVDASGNVYVADTYNQRIRKVSPAGTVGTLAGSGVAEWKDGTGAAASFKQPEGVAVDAAGNVYVADTGNNRIRMITPAGVVTTVAGSGVAEYKEGTGTAASFNAPGALTLDSSGAIYIADTGNHCIRKMTPAGLVSKVAGSGNALLVDGQGTDASFNGPSGIALDAAGILYVSDTQNHAIRKVTPAGNVTTLAGSGTASYSDGAGAAAAFNYPSGTAVDALGNVYIGDSANGRIRRVTAGGIVTTLAGSGAASFADGEGVKASFNELMGVALSRSGDLYAADSFNCLIRKVTLRGIGELAVRWSAPVDTGGSVIARYTASASADGQTTRTCATTGATSCTIQGLTSGAAYRVSITASNAAGASAPSATVDAVAN